MRAVPYLTGKITYGFGHVGARNCMGLGTERVVSILGSELERIVSSLRDINSKKAISA